MFERLLPYWLHLASVVTLTPCAENCDKILLSLNLGRAAYFSEEEKHRRIIDTDYSLWNVLKHKNSSLSKEVTYSDIYYASIGDVSVYPLVEFHLYG